MISFNSSDQLDTFERQVIKPYYVLSIMFAFVLIISNISAVKFVKIYFLDIPADLFFFPLVYVLSTCLTEIYGFKAALRTIWFGCISNLAFSFLLYIAVLVPSDHSISTNFLYDSVVTKSLWITFSGVISLFFGLYFAAIVLARSKIIFFGDQFLLRYLMSSAVGILIESAFFIPFMFVDYGKTGIPEAFLYSSCIKLIYQIIVAPLVSLIVLVLKNFERIDYYDYKTKYSPFNIF